MVVQFHFDNKISECFQLYPEGIFTVLNNVMYLIYLTSHLKAFSFTVFFGHKYDESGD